MRAALRAWPARRWVTALVLLPLATLLLARTGGGADGWWSWPAVAVTAGPAAMVLASYLPLPGAGWRLDVGCSPCAAAAAFTVLLAVMARSTAPGDPAMAGIAAVLVVAGLRQRLSDTTVCRVAVRDERYPGR